MKDSVETDRFVSALLFTEALTCGEHPPQHRLSLDGFTTRAERLEQDGVGALVGQWRDLRFAVECLDVLCVPCQWLFCFRCVLGLTIRLFRDRIRGPTSAQWRFPVGRRWPWYWSAALCLFELCCGIVFWRCVLELCFGDMFWSVFWRCVLGACCPVLSALCSHVPLHERHRGVGLAGGGDGVEARVARGEVGTHAPRRHPSHQRLHLKNERVG